MARKLPWERKGTRPRLPASAHRRSFSPARAGPSRRDGGDVDDKDDTDDRDDRADNGERRTRKRQKQNGSPSSSASAVRYRTPSTSPPPAPPTEAYMVEGLDNDDKYRMVEDELLAVAQAFTAHLHAAEYQRLKAKAKQQATATGSWLLPRPVTSAPTDRVKKRAEMAQQRSKQRKALKMLAGRNNDDDVNDDSDDDNAPWAGTSLQDLMESGPRKGKPALVSLASATPAASAGKQSEMSRLRYRPLAGSSPLKAVTSVDALEGETESDDEGDLDDLDDLDGPPAKKTKTQLKRRNTPPPAPAETSRPPQPPQIPQKTPSKKRTVSFAPVAREIPPPPERDGRSDGFGDEVEDKDEDEDDGALSDLDGGDLMDKIRKRREKDRAARQRRQRQQRQQREARGAG